MQSEDKRLQASTEALQNMKTIKVGSSLFLFKDCFLTFLVKLLGKDIHGKNKHPQKKGAYPSCQGLIVLVCDGFLCKYLNIAGDHNNNRLEGNFLFKVNFIVVKR